MLANYRNNVLLSSYLIILSKVLLLYNMFNISRIYNKYFNYTFLITVKRFKMFHEEYQDFDLISDIMLHRNKKLSNC